ARSDRVTSARYKALRLSLQLNPLRLSYFNVRQVSLLESEISALVPGDFPKSFHSDWNAASIGPGHASCPECPGCPRQQGLSKSRTTVPGNVVPVGRVA